MAARAATAVAAPRLTTVDGGDAIKRAAIGAFAAHGYPGTSVREIASRAGMSVATIYHHYPAKLNILFEVMGDAMTRLIDETERAVAAAGEDPVEQLRAAITTHLVLHTQQQDESFVGNSELRSLTPPMRQRIVAQRDRQQRFFDRAVEQIGERCFPVKYPRDASRAIVTMCTSVAHWYRKDGELTPKELAERYCDMSLALLRGNSGRSRRPVRAREKRGVVPRARASSGSTSIGRGSDGRV